MKAANELFESNFSFDLNKLELSNFDRDILFEMCEAYIPQSFMNESPEKLIHASANRTLIVLFMVEHAQVKHIPSDIVETLLYSVDSFGRPEVLQALHDKVDSIYWLKLFANYWTMCDSCSLYHTRFKEIFSNYSIETIRQEIHSEEDWEFYNSLPEVFTAYRGTFLDERFKGGLSWTTNQDVAKRFEYGYFNFAKKGPMLFRYQSNMRPEIFKTMLEIAEGGTAVLQADFFKEDVFVLTSRSESEILVIQK